MNVIWNVPIGGRTTPIVQKGHVYLINRTGDGVTQQERVMALDEITGKVLWEHKFNVWHTDIVADRLGWTNMVGDPETDTDLLPRDPGPADVLQSRWQGGLGALA